MAYIFTQVGTDWDSLTNSEKEALFENYQHAGETDLKTLGKFKVVSYSTTSGSPYTKVQVDAVPNDILVLPLKLFGSPFYTIKSITISEDVSDATNAKIRYVITKDLSTYYTFSSSTFTALSSVDASTVLSDGMTASNLLNITEDEWATFYDGDVDIDGIGIAFAFSETDVSQKTAIDNMNMVVDIRGTWNKATHGTDYTYGYTGNNTLHFNLLKDGSYKVNYQYNVND